MIAPGNFHHFSPLVSVADVAHYQIPWNARSAEVPLRIMITRSCQFSSFFAPFHFKLRRITCLSVVIAYFRTNRAHTSIMHSGFYTGFYICLRLVSNPLSQSIRQSGPVSCISSRLCCCFLAKYNGSVPFWSISPFSSRLEKA